MFTQAPSITLALLMLIPLGPAGRAAAQPVPVARMVGYARLPADTFRPGPPSTNAPRRRGQTSAPMWDSQPVQGVSSLRHAGDGTFWALSDNGFGTRRNSGSYILVLYRLSIDWKTAEGGSGAVTVVETVELSDPARFVKRISNKLDARRRLTGADFDPESLHLGADGSFWIGDEFGPWLLHFSRAGELLQAPIPAKMERGGKWVTLRSPENRRWGRYNLSGSRGFEGLTHHPGLGGLVMLLEGTVKGERPGQLRLFSYLPGGPPYASSTAWRYPLEQPGHSIGEITWWPERGLFLVLERDWGHGPQAKFKKVFAWSPQVGQAAKAEVVDLMDMADPDHLASESGRYTMPYVTIESVLPLDGGRLIIANDNNFPAVGGRAMDRRDDTEFILLQVEFDPQSP
ncbi:MAG: esterase-like activity of phytase family protein [Candidatus Marinimicrobia bacterium]|nr:esterase-like activity of phytase family protein [Candidatus Neomarinimicrobiota bacterium]